MDISQLPQPVYESYTNTVKSLEQALFSALSSKRQAELRCSELQRDNEGLRKRLMASKRQAQAGADDVFGLQKLREEAERVRELARLKRGAQKAEATQSRSDCG